MHRLVAVIAALTCGNIASAQDAPADEERARVLYLEGDTHYAAGRYEQAITSFEAAYALSPKPALQYNLANAYERLGNYEAAAKALTTYLASPDARDVVSVRGRIARLEASVKAQREREAQAAKEREELIERARRVEEKPPEPAAVEPRPSVLAPTGAEVDTAPSDRRIGAWVVSGVAAAALGAGIATAIVSSSAKSDAESACGTSGICSRAAESDFDKHRRFALVADISFAAALVGAGVATYLFLRPKPRDERAIAIDLGASKDSFGVGVSGAF